MAGVVLLQFNLPRETGFNVLCSCVSPLEVQDTVSDRKYIKSTSDPQRPSKRKAAIEARPKIHMWTQ